MRRLATTAVLVAAAWWALAVPTAAQDEPAYTVRAVEFTGAHRTGEVYARDVVRVSPGDPADPAALDAAVGRLLRTGRFLSVTYDLEPVDDGVRVVFHVREHPVVKAILFEGNSHFGDGRLAKLVGQAIDKPVDWLAVREGRDAVVALYREEGYGDVKVSENRDRLEQTGELIFVIAEGKRVRVSKVRFEGNDSIRASELKKHVETKPKLWIFRTGAFDEDKAESDVAQLQRYYRDEGFLDARVTYRREISEDGADLVVIFVIDEGGRYAVETIDCSGNAVFSDAELLALMQSGAGRPVKRREVDADVQAVQTRYGELGYIYAEARAVRVFSDTPGLVRLTVEINEGDQYRVGRVIVRGNARTKDKVVRRALNLYPPDDLFDLTEAREAERRLVETRVFGAAKVYPAGDAPGVRDAVIDVTEAEKAGDFLFGVGVTSNSGVVGNIVLNLQNFDVFDRPRSWAEFLKFRSFFGAGQQFRIELQPGTEMTRFRVDFTEPYLLDRPIRFDMSGYYFERGRDGYDEERRGLTASLGRRFEHGWLHGWSGEAAVRVENAIVGDVDLFASREIRKDKGSNILTSLKLSAVRDRTDSRLVPTRGDRLRIGYEQFGMFGGDHVFGEATAGYTWYKTVRTDLLERKSVLQLRADGGMTVGDAPVFERFYAGGTGSIRGFEYRGIGPRDGIDQNNIGGDYLILLGGEYSFPLVGENVQGLFFLDSGTVGSGPWRAAIGTGVRFTLDLFGPVPLELDLAMPVSSDPDDDERIFSFQIGTLF